MKTVKLGSLNIAEDKIVVSDPSFDYGDSGMVLLKKVLSGKYFASIKATNLKDCGQIVTSLKICHSDYKNSDLKFERYGFIAVDSGQAGFFDKNYFVKNQGGEVGDTETLRSCVHRDNFSHSSNISQKLKNGTITDKILL